MQKILNICDVCEKASFTALYELQQAKGWKTVSVKLNGESHSGLYCPECYIKLCNYLGQQLTRVIGSV